MLVHEGKFCWYELCDGSIRSDDPVQYTVHELTDEERAGEESWYPLYMEHIGDVACGNNKPPSEWNKFYTPYSERLDYSGRGERSSYSTRPVIGWFEM